MIYLKYNCLYNFDRSVFGAVIFMAYFYKNNKKHLTSEHSFTIIQVNVRLLV